MNKTWSTLGLNRMLHNICFTWVLFERYVTTGTGQVEPDLLSATLMMLQHVSQDARKAQQEPGYSRVLSATLASVYSWAENKLLLDYHEAFDKSSMKNAATLAVLAAELLGQHAPAAAAAAHLIER
ncbi:hypothetical protein ZWY2020_059333 [Hordeum vulgare]|nr:hypothetical protein ZWY2020_014059 [Hordeum vulgare]KAI5015794.1 hypothetical protein ZWY2020_059333 [Hordeum vulgare]